MKIILKIAITHKNTDFDALASVIAVTLLYPDTLPVLPKQINPNVKAFLSLHKDLFPVSTMGEIELEKIDTLIVVDANSWNRLEGIESLRQRSGLEVILWDHHPAIGSLQADWKCQEEMGATITLLVRHLKREKKILTPMQATLFLTGLYEDTGNLSFACSKPEDAYAAAYLLERKADLNVLNSFLRPVYGEKQKNVLFEMLRSAQRDRINGYSVSINKLTIQGHVDQLAVVVGMYREILNADAAFGIFCNPDQGRCMVIGRSRHEGIRVGEIMRSMGGGGHPGAGSALLKSVNPDAVEGWLTELIRGNQQSSVQVGDLMSFPVISVRADASMEEVALLLREKGCTGLPVVENQKLVGMISRRDFRKIKRRSKSTTPVKSFMNRNVITIDPGQSPIHAARLMVKHDIGRLPVIENDRIIGIITRSDTMLYLYDLLPD